MGQGMSVAGVVAALLAGGALHAQTAPEQAEPLRPKGAWTAAFEESACVLSRGYGEGATAMQLAFGLDTSSRYVEVAVVAPHAGAGFSREGDAEVALLPSGQHAKGYYRDYTIAGGKRVLRVSVKRDEITDLTTAASIRVTRTGQLPLHFALSNTAKAMATLQTCQDDLTRSWGLDPAALSNLSRKLMPAGNPVKWITNDAYPQEALRAGQQGVVHFRLIVDTDGRVADCTVTQSSGTKLLDDTVCTMLRKNARFDPALGPDGKPVRAPWNSRFSWRIPGRGD